MKTRNKEIGLLLLPLMAIFLLLQVESNAQVKAMSAQELTTESTSIFFGKCIQMESAWTNNQEMIFTTITIVPEYYLKGNMGNEVKVTVPGGQVGDIIYEVSEMPAFRKGEEVFAFVWKHPSGLNLITGGSQGKMHIVTDERSGTRKVSGRQLSKAVPITTRPQSTRTTAKPEMVPLDDFTSEVEGYLNER